MQYLNNEIHIGGKSYAYGSADHSIGKEILLRTYSERNVVIQDNDWMGFGDEYRDPAIEKSKRVPKE